MKRILLFVSIISCLFGSISAQKEVYFSTIEPDSIKVESMNGILIQSNFNPLGFFNKFSKSVPLSIGYFNEKRIAPTWTLISSAEIGCGFFKEPELLNLDSAYASYGSSLTYKTRYSVGLNFGLEPRWYLGYKSRYQKGIAGLNSGWYMSLPVAVGTTLISNSTYLNKSFYFDKFYAALSFAPSLGYRQEVGKHFFLEGDLMYLSGNMGLYEKNKSVFVSGPIFNFNPVITIKAAYTFK